MDYPSLMANNIIVRGMHFERIGAVPIEWIFSLLGKGGKRKRKIKFGDYNLRLGSKKLRTFKRGFGICKHCNVKGNFFAIERHKGEKRFHLNLYAIDKCGHPRLMTIDHVLPRSKGGNSKMKNLQILCTRCNSKKGDKLEC